ncbi:MAG: TolC family protein, partial [Cyanobacteria bacterium REEB65]|nr:TolC family protein [Cyanobacteria bacterium REEB65]
MIPLLAIAQLATASPHVLTLAAALDAAHHRQPELAQAAANLQVAQARQDEAVAPLLPQLSGSVAATHRAGIGSVSPVDRQVSPDNGDFGLSVSQLVWDFGQGRSRLGAAKAAVGSQEQTVQATRQQVDLTVRQA